MIERVRKEVAQLLAEDNSGHGMDHIDRVLALSLRFAEKENADPQVTALIALLHDVDDYKLCGVESAEKLVNAKRVMTDCHIYEKLQDQVCSELHNIGYSKRLQGRCPVTIEGQVVSDADMCDSIGATGIIRAYTYSIKQGRPFFDRNHFPAENLNAEEYMKGNDASTVVHCFEKLFKLKGLMLTESGRAEAENRHRIMVDFLHQLFEEENAPEWAEYMERYLGRG